MAARNAKRSISTILGKNRGLWTVYGVGKMLLFERFFSLKWRKTTIWWLHHTLTEFETTRWPNGLITLERLNFRVARAVGLAVFWKGKSNVFMAGFRNYLALIFVWFQPTAGEVYLSFSRYGIQVFPATTISSIVIYSSWNRCLLLQMQLEVWLGSRPLQLRR